MRQLLKCIIQPRHIERGVVIESYNKKNLILKGNITYKLYGEINKIILDNKQQLNSQIHKNKI